MFSRKRLVVFTLALSIAMVGSGQEPGPQACPDFLDHIKALLSEDPAVRAAASAKRPASDCLVELLPKHKQYLDSEILPLVARGLASLEDEVRVHASAIPVFVATFRDDRAEVLESFVPLMFDRLYDRDRKVRQNSVIVVSIVVGGLKPGPPPVALEHLVHYLENPAGEFRDSAFAGLAHVSPMTDRIAQVLEKEIARTEDVAAKGNLLANLGELRELHPRMLSALIDALDAPEPYVVEKAVVALMQQGPAAAAAAPALRKLAAERRFGDEIAKLAARAIDRVEGKQKDR